MRNVKETLKYILKRVLLMLATFLIIFLISFALVRALPIAFNGGAGADETKFYMQQVSIGRMYEKDGEFYNNPIPVQFINFVKNLIVPNSYVVDGPGCVPSNPPCCRNLRSSPSGRRLSDR